MKYTLYANAKNTEIGIPYASSNSKEYLMRLSVYKNNPSSYIMNNVTKEITECSTILIAE